MYSHCGPRCVHTPTTKDYFWSLLPPPLKEKKNTHQILHQQKMPSWACGLSWSKLMQFQDRRRITDSVQQFHSQLITIQQLGSTHTNRTKDLCTVAWFPIEHQGCNKKVATKHKNPQNPFPQRYWHYLTVLSYREIPWRPQGRKNKKNVSSVASTRRTFSSPGQCLFQKGHGLGKWILEFVHDWSSP